MRWEPVFDYISKTTFLLATLREVTIVAHISPTKFSPRQTNSKEAELEEETTLQGEF